MSRAPQIKVCGITREEDVEACVRLGVEVIGLNFWSGSPRCVDAARGARLARHAQGRVRVVGVFVDAGEDEIRRTVADVGLDGVQLHGSEPDALLSALGPAAYRAVRLRDEHDVSRALAAPGEVVLVDAFDAAAPGGTGVLTDLALAAKVAASRRTWLAGGLRAANVAARIETVRPFGVDVASGVERAPGIKDLAALEAFVHAARG